MLGLLVNVIVLWNTLYLDTAWPNFGSKAVRSTITTPPGYHRSASSTSTCSAISRRPNDLTVTWHGGINTNVKENGAHGLITSCFAGLLV